MCNIAVSANNISCVTRAINRLKHTLSKEGFTLRIIILTNSSIAIVFHIVAWVAIHDIHIIWAVGICSIAILREITGSHFWPALHSCNLELENRILFISFAW